MVSPVRSVKVLVFVFLILFYSDSLGDFSRGQSYEANQKKDLIEQRKAYKKAMSFLKNNQFSNFSKEKEGLKNYSLYPYLEFNEKIYRISRYKEKQILKFLEDYSDTPLGQPLLSHWLPILAKRGHWTVFLRNYSQLINPSNELECLHSYALYKRKSKFAGLDKAARLWTVGFSQPKECDTIFHLLNTTGRISSEMAWSRLSLSIKANENSLSKYLLRYIAENQAELASNFRLVHSNPNVLKKLKRFSADTLENKEIVLHGISRLSRREPVKALELLNQYSKLLSFETSKLNETYKKIGLSLSRREIDQSLLDSLPIKLRDHPDFVEARIRHSLRIKDWSNVLVLINLFSEETKDLEKWKYWKARVLSLSEDYADREVAQDIYSELSQNRSFYGFLASDIMETDYNYNHEVHNISYDETIRLEKNESVKRALELFALGYLGKARQEWNSATSKLEQHERILAANLALRWGWHKASIQTMIQSKNWDSLTERFPVAHKDVFTRHARQLDIPISWSLAVARQESAFMPDAKSAAGARGLMQLMPSTARLIAKSEGIKYSSQNKLLEVDLNIRLGTNYLRWMLGRYNNNRILASAAYNAGPGNVDKWVNKDLPLDVWIETIPFKETRTYVKNVLAYSTIYNYLLGQESPFIFAGEKEQFGNRKAQKKFSSTINSSVSGF